MNKKFIIILCMLIVAAGAGILIIANNQNKDGNKTEGKKASANMQNATSADVENAMLTNTQNKEESEKVEYIKIKINNNELTVKLENNIAVDALIEKLKEGNITVNAREYGNFEKVGNLGFSLPTNDSQVSTEVGDVMLYQGNQITLFYGSNSWNYTRIGKIVNTSEAKLKSILGDGDTTFVMSIN